MRFYTKKEDKIIQDNFNKDVSDRDIATKLYRKVRSVQNRRYALGLVRRKEKNWKKKEVEILLAGGQPAGRTKNECKMKRHYEKCRHSK